MRDSIIWWEPTHQDPGALAAADIPSISMMAGQLKPVIFGTKAKYLKNSGPGSQITRDLKEEIKMCDFFDIEDWMIIGPLSENLADEEKNQKSIEVDLDQEEDDTVVK